MEYRFQVNLSGIIDLLSAFRNVVMQRPKRIPVHEVEIDDVTIEDRMQEVEIALNERGRSQFEDLFPHDNRTIVKVVTLMAMLELCKLDRVVFRQSRALGAIWVYRKARSAEFELELKVDEGHQDPLPDFRPGLPELIREQAKQRTAQTALEAALRELEQELANPGQAEKAAADAAAAAAAATAAAAEVAGDAGVSAAAVAAIPAEAAPEVSPGDAVPSGESLDTPAPEATSPEEASPGTHEAAESETSLESGLTADQAPTEIAEPLDSAEAPSTPEEKSALQDLLNRVREAPEPDLSVPDADGDDD